MQFQVGERYTAEEIQRFLEVGNAGGIRISLDSGKVRRVALLTVVPTAKLVRENPYHDRIEGDVLVYSAAGCAGTSLSLVLTNDCLSNVSTASRFMALDSTKAVEKQPRVAGSFLVFAVPACLPRQSNRPRRRIETHLAFRASHLCRGSKSQDNR